VLKKSAEEYNHCFCQITRKTGAAGSVQSAHTFWNNVYMQLLTVVRRGLEKTYQENPVGKKLQARKQAQAPAGQLTRRNTFKKETN